MNKLKSIFIFVLMLESGSLKGMSKSAISVARIFIAHGVVPDLIPKAPPNLLKVNYPSGVRVEEGNELTPAQVKDVPKVSWDAKTNSYYTLCMVDPDSPSRTNPVSREWQHWLVGNIHGSKMKTGEVLSEYIGVVPPRDTGLHRYVLLVYHQKRKLNFTEPMLKSNSASGRITFSIIKFAEKYRLGNPVAGNFFVAQYDDFVLELFREIYK